MISKQDSSSFCSAQEESISSEKLSEKFQLFLDNNVFLNTPITVSNRTHIIKTRSEQVIEIQDKIFIVNKTKQKSHKITKLPLDKNNNYQIYSNNVDTNNLYSTHNNYIIFVEYERNNVDNKISGNIITILILIHKK